MNRSKSSANRGETNLVKMLETLRVTRDPNSYVYCSVAAKSVTTDLLQAALASFRETEGVTLILTEEQANLIQFECERSDGFSKLTLDIHSSLDAVGLTAAVAQALTDHGISANVVAAYYHDHIFVPEDAAENAIQALLELRNL